MRYALDITYKGTDFSGWQIQPNAPSIQEELNKAISTVLRQEAYVVGAGRTDAGVHARQMIAHFEYEQELSRGFVPRVSGLLPYDIAVNALIRPKNPQFHARFDAKTRAYTYHIISQKNPIKREFATRIRYQLDWGKMQEAAAVLLEYEEFGAFCKSKADNETNLCNIHHSYWKQVGDEWIYHVKANRFLRGMVRAIVGTLLLVGRGKLQVEDVRKIIESQDRRQAGASVEARGLFLNEVTYEGGMLEEVIEGKPSLSL